jgi:mannose/fructose-specific phosphotransferase system component IIA
MSGSGKTSGGTTLAATDRVLFITRHGKEILLIDVSNCSADQVEKVFRSVPDLVTTRPPASVLALTDFTGATFNREAIRVIKETAVFNKPYVKKSACVGKESLPFEFPENVISFSNRRFSAFKTREEALDWLTKD